MTLTFDLKSKGFLLSWVTRLIKTKSTVHILVVVSLYIATIVPHNDLDLCPLILLLNTYCGKPVCKVQNSLDGLIFIVFTRLFHIITTITWCVWAFCSKGLFVLRGFISKINKVKMREKIQKDWNSKTNICPSIYHVDIDADTDTNVDDGVIAIVMVNMYAKFNYHNWCFSLTFSFIK